MGAQHAVFFLVTLGCKVNQYETHALREAWIRKGWVETTAPEQASAILVNSCAVTAKAVADVRSTVRRLHRAAPDAAIIITGCAAQALGAELATLAGVHRVVGQQDKTTLLQGPFIEIPLQSTHEPNSAATNSAHTSNIQESTLRENDADKAVFPAFAVSGYDRSRAVVKIQDGCSHRCTYCIVPLTRGKAGSRPPEESLAEIQRFLDAGFREIGISGVNLRQYGRDLPTPHDFWDFLAQGEQRFAAEWYGHARFRISSLEPGQLGTKALEVLGNSRLVAPHLHLSLQSGSMSVLRRMGRGHYNPDTIEEFLRQLRTVWPVFALGADILTAFPGETDAEFEETLATCATLPFTYAHVFPYSKRPGTPAAAMPDQVPEPVKKERAARLRSLLQEKKDAFLLEQCRFSTVQVVFEARDASTASAKPHSLRGLNEWYTECLLERNIGYTPQSCALTKGQPVRVEKGMLVVRPCP